VTQTPAGGPAGVRASGDRAPAGRTSAIRLGTDRGLVELSVAGVMVVWAANFIVVKDVLQIMPPIGFTFARYVLASLTLLLILWRSEGALRLPRPDGWRIIALGGIGFGLYQILWTVGLQSIPAGDSALLIASTPVVTAVLAVLVGTDTLSPTKALGVAVSFIGVVIVIGAGVGIDLTGSPIGFALTLGAAVCWGTFTAVGARILQRRSPLVLTTWGTVGGALVLAIPGIGQLVAPGAVDLSAPGALQQIVLSVAYSGILAAALANVVVFNGVRWLGPTRVITIQALVPAFAVVLAFLFLGEPIRLGQVLGGAIILGGVALTRIASRRPAPRRSAA
jgi:drug/metabolite transporter (DMT)-like permease